MVVFHYFEHSTLSIWIIKQNKNNWARDCIKHSYNFMQFWYRPLINLPKNMGEKTKTDKNILKIIIKQNKNNWERNYT